MDTETRTLTYEHHPREAEGMTFCYPVLSRRAGGVSIGINLNPDKVCNFNCVYCQVDRTRPGSSGVELSQIRNELLTLLTQVAKGTLFGKAPFNTLDPSKQRVNDIAFSGNGEPTASTVFPDTVRLVVELKRQLGLERLKVVLITNGSLLHRPAVKEALTIMDGTTGEIWAKLDAGSEDYYRRINRSAVPFSRIIDNITETSRLRPVVIQTMLPEVDGWQPVAREIEAYVATLRGIMDRGGHLRQIQLYSVARKPPTVDVYSLPPAEMEKIGRHIHDALNVPVDVFYGSDDLLNQKPR